MAVLFTVLAGNGFPLHAETFDPTRPPVLNKSARPAPVVHRPRLNPQDYRVTSILVSEQRKVAVINNQVVTIGDTVKAGESGDATITNINAAEVTLSKARQEIVVRLPSSQYTRALNTHSVITDAAVNSSAVSGQPQGLKDQP
jgi:hypothetical protein